MIESSEKNPNQGERHMTSVLIFWLGYVFITLAVGFATSMLISSEIWQLTAWGFISSAGLLALSLLLSRNQSSKPNFKPKPKSMRDFTLGLLLGVGSFAIHVAIVSTFAGPIRFEMVPTVGALAAVIFFMRFLSTSCMEEIGFHGLTLQRMASKWGVWTSVCITAIAFGLSHLLYGWDIQTIALGVIPGGLLWGMSAITTKGVAMPIGLHAAWNFASWTAGNRAETGLLKMIVAEEALESTRRVGTISYLMIFGLMTLTFWFVHMKNTRHNQGSYARKWL